MWLTTAHCSLAMSMRLLAHLRLLHHKHRHRRRHQHHQQHHRRRRVQRHSMPLGLKSNSILDGLFLLCHYYCEVVIVFLISLFFKELFPDCVKISHFVAHCVPVLFFFLKIFFFFFENNDFCKTKNIVLYAYAAHNPSVGYTQVTNYLLLIIVVVCNIDKKKRYSR